MTSHIPDWELNRMRATADDVRSVISTVQRWVLKAVPRATLMYGRNKKGEIVNVAIYDCKVVLDHNGHLDVKASQAPQRISMLDDWREDWGKRNDIGALKIVANVWIDALFRQLQLGAISSLEFRQQFLIPVRKGLAQFTD